MSWRVEGIKRCVNHPDKLPSHKVLYKESVTFICVYCAGLRWPEGAEIIELKRKKYFK